MLREFKPAILFLSKFLAIYLLANFLYGLFITAYYPLPDPVTSWVTSQSSAILQWVGYETSTQIQDGKPNVLVIQNGRSIIAVYEGCNGLNVMIIFVAFMIAFGPWSRRSLLFGLFGTFVVHLANLLRITVLFHVALDFPGQLYFLHKYFFTAFLYLVVFVLWYFWIDRMQLSKPVS